MKTASPATLAILNTTGNVQMLRADLWTITPRSGGVLRFTDADINLLVAGQTFLSGPIITRSKTKQSIGVTVDTVQCTVTDDGRTLVSGKPIIHQFRNGYFKGASVKIQKLFLLDWNDTSGGPVDWFEGVVGAPSCDNMAASFEVRSFMEVLNKQMPADIYQDTCNNDLFDTVCGASRAAFTFNGTSGASSDRKTFALNGVVQPDTFFVFGKVVFTSGANAGQPARTIKRHASGILEVFQPFPYAVASGDACTVTAGCDKLQTTCGSKFGRLSTGFQATPYIPVPETAIEGGGVGGVAATSGSTGTAVVGSNKTSSAAKNTYVK